ncbi:unnamed protein product [Auanema sp. JU1783]|nr:unnamed protein product [Auanema sp. JU1783]
MSECVELVVNGGNCENDKIQARKLTKQYTNEIVMGTDEDPFNKPELVHTLKGKELCLFVIFYAFAVCLIVLI